MCVKTKEISFLGYSISGAGIKPDRSLVEKILVVKTPTCKKDVEHFVGLVNFFGRHIKNCADMIEPLNELKRKTVPFEWNVLHQNAFDKLKSALSEYPLVQPFDPNKETELTTDASEKAVSGIISQNGHPVMYMSRKLSSSEQKLQQH